MFPNVDDDTASYVCVTLLIELVPGYPDERARFTLKNPRGLSDCTLDTISRNINAKLDENRGAPVVFDLIDVVREHLTDSNMPSGQCVICLYGFQEDDQFTKTECYHYLHTYCLARHLDASKRNYDEEFNKLPGWQQLTAKPYHAACPVCREPIDCDRSTMQLAAPPNELVKAPKFKLTEEIRCLQSKMAEMYLHQKERGGIIDLEAEEPQILAIVNPQEEAAERERARLRDIERAEAAAAAAAIEAERVPKKGSGHKKNHNSHYEHKHVKKGHHQHHHHHRHPRHGARSVNGSTGETTEATTGQSSSQR